ncbi:hypothetical protein B0H17DRAFT_1130352 [Mycena rosella]|uniref:Uncharacterized protein n=1 Tax=Mycena rosella TaxID=1033263 RepID=A0AAD7DRJ2_MYCRO|nr:hypothetical protein B0H17DRAFT_1130352 [Mycena rosella]
MESDGRNNGPGATTAGVGRGSRTRRRRLPKGLQEIKRWLQRVCDIPMEWTKSCMTIVSGCIASASDREPVTGWRRSRAEETGVRQSRGVATYGYWKGANNGYGDLRHTDSRRRKRGATTRIAVHARPVSRRYIRTPTTRPNFGIGTTCASRVNSFAKHESAHPDPRYPTSASRRGSDVYPRWRWDRWKNRATDGGGELRMGGMGTATAGGGGRVCVNDTRTYIGGVLLCRGRRRGKLRNYERAKCQEPGGGEDSNDATPRAITSARRMPRTTAANGGAGRRMSTAGEGMRGMHQETGMGGSRWECDESGMAMISELPPICPSSRRTRAHPIGAPKIG